MPLPLLIAVQFLTRLPIRLPGLPPPEAVGRSVLWYPVVGLLLGGLLSVIAWLGASGGVLLQAALVLAGWVILTGGLHLDGLADTVDAWVGGYGDRERTLAIMKDPACGPMGVLALLLTLLLKWSALVVLLPQASASLWLAPVAGRLALPWLLLTTSYVRPGGLGDILSRHLPRTSLGRVLLIGALLLALLPQGVYRSAGDGRGRALGSPGAAATPGGHHGRYRRGAAGAERNGGAGRLGTAHGVKIGGKREAAAVLRSSSLNASC
ncbi:adenosylcobinamide-GDP ribazoletransferase [Pseudomonas psychrotolerans]|nr:adenosylcobinamide-GDP ribazoletransferase [Pseudomonas psychrotolerans]